MHPASPHEPSIKLCLSLLTGGRLAVLACAVPPDALVLAQGLAAVLRGAAAALGAVAEAGTRLLGRLGSVSGLLGGSGSGLFMKADRKM